MKRLTITDKELIIALRRMAPETGSLICLGCGYERRCSVHGCAVLKAAVGRLEELTAPPSNDPLTLEQLREMDGEPVWISYVNSAKGKYHIVRAFGPNSIIFDEYDKEFGPYKSLFLGNCGKTWLAYRRRPEEGTA